MLKDPAGPGSIVVTMSGYLFKLFGVGTNTELSAQIRPAPWATLTMSTGWRARSICWTATWWLLGLKMPTPSSSSASEVNPAPVVALAGPITASSSATNRPSNANRPTPSNTPPAKPVESHYHTGSAATTSDAPTAPSGTNHPSIAFGRPPGSTSSLAVDVPSSPNSRIWPHMIRLPSCRSPWSHLAPSHTCERNMTQRGIRSPGNDGADSSWRCNTTAALEVAMRDRRRTSAGGVQAEKQQRYVQLIAQGVNNSEACRLVGIDRKTGNRWRYGRRVRNSAGALVVYPPVKIKQARPRSPRYLSELERIQIADLLAAKTTARGRGAVGAVAVDGQPRDPSQQRSGRPLPAPSRGARCQAPGRTTAQASDHCRHGAG